MMWWGVGGREKGCLGVDDGNRINVVGKFRSEELS